DVIKFGREAAHSSECVPVREIPLISVAVRVRRGGVALERFGCAEHSRLRARLCARKYPVHGVVVVTFVFGFRHPLPSVCRALTLTRLSGTLALWGPITTSLRPRQVRRTCVPSR